jgi:hypothetical protein
MPNVTPERLREAAQACDKALGECRAEGCEDLIPILAGRASAFREIADMLEEQERAAAFLVIPHDPNYHCWGK